MLDDFTTVLIVEDTPEDYQTTVRGLRKAGFKNPVAHCVDGDDALDYLRQQGKYADEKPPRPAVVLLDLNLPGTDGREVLAEMKADPDLRWIPVIILTTSDDDRDIDSCYEAGANTYVQKPVDLQAFMNAIQRLTEYWIEVAILPKGPPATSRSGSGQ